MTLVKTLFGIFEGIPRFGQKHKHVVRMWQEFYFGSGKTSINNCIVTSEDNKAFDLNVIEITIILCL